MTNNIKQIIIILIVFGLLEGSATGASRHDIKEDSPILDEHELRLDYNEFHRMRKDLTSIADSAEKGIDWVLSQSDFAVGTLWVLGKLSQITGDERLKELYQRELEAARHKESFKYYPKLFDDEVVVEELPESDAISRTDLMVMKDWLIAAVNCKDFAPSEEVLRELFDNRYRGYLSTHQYLAIMWLKEQGYQDDRIEPKIKEIVEQMLSEQVAEDKFTDLVAERIAFILYAGYAEKIESEWIETILDAQKEDGHWTSPAPKIDAYISDLHTTILAVWALIQYDRRKDIIKFFYRARIY